jgi:hypothetical protein
VRYPWAVPGRKVVCIKEGKWRKYLPGEVHPVNGQTLTIRDVSLGNDGDVYLRFREITNPPIRGHKEVNYRIDRFRPLHTVEDDVALFAELLTPAPNAPMLPETTE